MWPLIVISTLIGAKTLRSAGFAYDYSKSGQDWVQGMCSSRERQSPINFNDLTIPPSGKLAFSYQIVSSAFELSNNGHTFAANFAGLGYGGITYENGWYNLMNVNVHAPSEHTFQGNHYPLELHFVHKKYSRTKIFKANAGSCSFTNGRTLNKLTTSGNTFAFIRNTSIVQIAVCFFLPTNSGYHLQILVKWGVGADRVHLTAVDPLLCYPIPCTTSVDLTLRVSVDDSFFPS